LKKSVNLKFNESNWIFTLREGLKLLSRTDRKKYFIGASAQTFIGILDIAAVALIGAVGYLTVSGFGVGSQSNKINNLLSILGVADYSIKTQTAILAISAAILFVIKTILSSFITYKMLYFLASKSTIASKVLAEKYFSRSTYTILHSNKSDSIYALSEGVDLLTTKSLAIFVTIISDGFLLLLLIVGLLIADPKLSFGTVVFFGFIARLVHIKQSSISRIHGLEIARIRNQIHDRLFEIHENFRELITRDSKNEFLTEFGKLRKKQSSTVAGMAFLNVQSKYIMEISLIIGGLTISALQFITKDSGRAIAMLTIFIAAGSRIVPALLRLQNSIVQINNISGMSRSSSILIHSNLNVPIVEETKAEKNTKFLPEILVNQVGFRYPGSNKLVLEDINLSISEFSFNAIVGPTGSGKSTLVDVMLGFLDPTSGSVSLGGFDPKEIFRIHPGKVAIIPQRINLVNANLRENLILGFTAFEISDDLVKKTLEQVQLHDFLESLPDGLDSSIGEFGSKISGGQRQRIGIARALITDPRILVLDEATSSLDAETERLISLTLQNLKRKITVISVAHRLSTVRNADQVIYLEDGQIKKSGNFDQVREAIPNFDKQAKLMGL
jgi:ABC-type multidrug transport system fused ATPase/permease subunit